MESMIESVPRLGVMMYRTLWVIGLYAVPAYLLSLPIWVFGRKRAGFLKRELLFILIPITCWFSMAFIPLPTPKKSLANLIEVILCGFLGGLILVPRLFIRPEGNREKFRVTLYSSIAVAIAGVLIYFFTPTLSD